MTISRRNVPAQLAWYLVVGGLSFLADIAVFLSILDLGVATAVVVGFAVGTLVNYALSRWLAFSGGRYDVPQEIIRLFVVALVGVALTVASVLALTSLGLSPLAAKLVATVLVFGWNYVGRRLFVFRPEMPEGTWSLSNQALAIVPGLAPDGKEPLVSEATGPAPDRPVRSKWIETLALRERFRDSYRNERDPIADERLSWRAQTFRHLVHLTPGLTILELGSGDGRFTRRLLEVTRGENPIVAASFSAAPAAASGDSPALERVALDDLPGVLAGRSFDCIVGLDILDASDCAATLDAVHGLLAPGGEVVFFESNPWNPWLKLRRWYARMFRGSDPRGLLSRPQLYELLSEVGLIRVFGVYTDFVYAPLTRWMIWWLRNLSIIAENTPGLRNFAGAILLHAQKPPRRLPRVSRSLCDHREFFGAVSVVIPCHNEEMNIGPLIDRLVELYGDYLHEIIPVDDNSRDSTAAVIARYAAADPRVRPVYRTPPNGVGRAITDGFRAATGRWVLSMDCDFQHLLPQIRDLFDMAATGAPVVVGSRFSRHSVLLNYPLMKIISNRAFHLVAVLLFGRQLRDVTNNLKLMRRDVADRLVFTSPGFAINAETGLQPILMGFRIAEAPISWINRTFDMGTSTFRLVKVGRGYVAVLWDVFRARYFGSGPYAELARELRTPGSTP